MAATRFRASPLAPPCGKERSFCGGERPRSLPRVGNRHPEALPEPREFGVQFAASNTPRSTGPEANPKWPWARERKSDSCHSGFGNAFADSTDRAIREAWMPSEVRRRVVIRRLENRSGRRERDPGARHRDTGPPPHGRHWWPDSWRLSDSAVSRVPPTARAVLWFRRNGRHMLE
jgi:hypothetical protein